MWQGSRQSLREEHPERRHRRNLSAGRERRPSAQSLHHLADTRAASTSTASINRAHSLLNMATLSLKISLEGGAVVKTMQFEPSTTVYDACRAIREKILEAGTGDPKEYGLFLTSDEDSKKGIWLEATRALDYYILRNGDVLHYNKKTRNLRVRMLDGTVKTLLVDDSQIVANLMVVICTKIGITNYDEYGLVREEQKEEADPSDRPNYGTLTMRRKHQEKERDAKMDQLRKKLRTDDEVNWVEGSKTLREQGVEGAETLLLRRKLFYSDRNVDSRDPVQLNLLYVQARDAILDGKHPVTLDKACEFAGIQCQIQFGNHNEKTHVPGFLELKEFLPVSYTKIRNVEKKVLREHRQREGLSELDAKVLYTKTARSLPTYGVTFFLVKEKMKGKNKLVPRLLGVTKDCVLRLDEKTKETIQSWPLTTVRRWCASPNTFTLDFGDYSDAYYSVQTTDAEHILQVIAGYIDIILRRQRAADHLGIEGDEGSAMLEDAVAPSKANIIQHESYKSGRVNTESVAKPAVMRPGAEGAKSFSVGHVTGAQQTTVSGQIITGHAAPAASQMQQTKVSSVLSEPQRALCSTISAGYELIRHTEESLVKATLPEMGSESATIKWKQSTMDTSRQMVTSQIAAMNAATAQVVTLTSGGTEEVDHTAVGAAISTITSNLPEMSRGVQMIAALLPEDESGERLLDATRRLCSAFTHLLQAAQPDTNEPRQNLLNAASKVGEASTSVLHTIGEDSHHDKETQDILLSLAKGVANTTAALVLKAKQVAAQCRRDPPLQSRIIAAATACALATSQLVACAKVVAPTLQSAACREQLSSAARHVTSSVERLLEACSHVEPPSPTVPGTSPPSPAVQELTAAARALTDALQTLLDHANAVAEERAVPMYTSTTTSVAHVTSAWERLAVSSSHSDLVRHARELGQATAHLITDIKTEAERQPSETQRKLLAAAKLLADATARMVEAARQCASQPEDRDKHDQLRKAAEELHLITVEYAATLPETEPPLPRLHEAARAAAAAAAALAAAAAAAHQHNTNNYSQETLVSECRQLNEQVPRLAEAVKQSLQRPGEPAARLDLLAAAESLVQSGGECEAWSRAALPTVSSSSARRHLQECARAFTLRCAALRSAVEGARAQTGDGDAELEAAEQAVRGLLRRLSQLEPAQLRPARGETAAWASSSLQTSSRQVGAAAAALRQGEPGPAPAHLASSLADYTAAVTAVAAAAAETDPHRANKVVTSGRRVVESSLTLLMTAREQTGAGPAHAQRLRDAARDLTQNLELTLEAAPAHSELDDALENINETLNILNMGEFPDTGRNYAELQSELTAAASELIAVSAEVSAAAAARAQDRLGDVSAQFGHAFNRLCGAAVERVGQTEDTDSRTLMVRCMKSVAVTSSRVLSSAKSVSQRGDAQAHQLTAAAADLAHAVNELVDACTATGPSQKACERALRSIEATRSLLAAPAHPLVSRGYFCTLDEVVLQSKTLSEGMSSMATSVKEGVATASQFPEAVGAVAAAVCALVECTAHAAYLVAVSDETSVAGRPGLVDAAQFSRSAAAVQRACSALADPASTQQQVLSAATVVARHTSALCNACRVASSLTARAHDKRHFVQAAKDVANCTASLVKDIKALDQDYTEENRRRMASATAPLLDAITSLCQFADAPEFAPVPARISAQAHRAQETILICGRDIITESCAMISAAKQLALTPAERRPWQSLAHHSKALSDSIKSLVTNIREKAPGQRECAAALTSLNKLTRDLDQVCIAAVQQDLQPRDENTLQGYTESIENAASEILERVEPVRVAARSEAENLGHAIVQMTSYAEPLVTACAGVASLVPESRAQADLLGCARTVLESLGALVAAAKDAAGNPRATAAAEAVETAAAAARAGLREVREAARGVAAAAGTVQPLLDRLAHALSDRTRMSLVGSYEELDSYVEYQTRMVGVAKEIAKLASDMTAAAATEPGQLVPLAGELCHKYELLAADSRGAAATTANADVANKVRSTVVEAGEAAAALVRAGGECRLSPAAPRRAAVAQHANMLNQKVVAVLSALQRGASGTQACIDACAAVAALLSDLDTTAMFASAGTLHPDKQWDSFSEHRELILQRAKALVESTRALVGAAASQDQLAEAARQATRNIMELTEVVKLGAMSLGAGNAESQVLLLNAARDVCSALSDLAAATAAAAGRHLATPHVDALKHAAKPDATKRWSVPVKPTTLPRTNRRRSINFGVRNDSYDSETDFYQSDLEDELIKLLDYSSQDDDVSPSVFHDNCEEIITYIENLMRHPKREPKDYSINDKYSLAAKFSLHDMNWRVLKYGENILLGEIKKLVDSLVDVYDRVEIKRKREKLNRLKASSDLDDEMKRLSVVLDDLEETVVDEQTTTTVSTVPTVFSKKRPLEEKLLKHRLKNPIFKVKKVKPVSLVINLQLTSKTPVKIEEVIDKVTSPEETNRNEADVVEMKEDDGKPQNKQFWRMFQDDTEWWRALAKRNLLKMEETRRELERFSGHELVLGEIENELGRYEKEKATLQSFISDVDNSKNVKKDLEYDKKYEDMVLKLIQFAKKDFNYKGFDPLIEQLKSLATHIEGGKIKTINIQDVIKMYSEIDITKYTYEELTVLEKYYTEIIRKYKKQNRVSISDVTDRDHLSTTNERTPSSLREGSPSYRRNVILNVNSTQNLTKNINQHSHSNQSSLQRTKNRHNREIFDITRTYPEEYYANNWWRIYEDILKSREKQYGSIDNWWNFYEAILNKEATDDEELNRIRTVVEYRNSLRRRPNSRLEHQLRMLDEIKNDSFKETEDVKTQATESVMVTNVTSLLKTVKAVEDEHTRGIRALESTIEAITQEISVLRSTTTPKSTATPEDLIRATRHMTSATARAVAAGSSPDQDHLTAAANLGRKTVLDLLSCCKAAAFTAETEDLKQRTLDAGESAAISYRDLLSAVLVGAATGGGGAGAAGAAAELPELSRRVARSVADIIAHAELLKGSDWVDPEDPTVIAEHELLGAAASIDAAAKKLDSLRPRKSVKVQEADETLNFDEMILEAARCIITATSALVRAASAAQRELIDQGKVARQPASSSDDGQWSEGLVSAARLVAAAAHALVEAANALVQGAGSEERLISSARQVASSTAQLLVACKVKADPSSESTRGLQAAGAEVIRSTENLVRAARDAICSQEERSLVLNRRMVGGIAQEIDARSDVLRIERELEEARGRLSAIRQAKYRLRGGDTSGDETDADLHLTAGYSSDASTPAPAPAPHRFKTLNSSFANTTYSPNSTFSPHSTQNSTNISQQVSQLNQSIHGSPVSPTYVKNNSYAGFGQNVNGAGQNSSGFGQTPVRPSTLGQSASQYSQNTSAEYSQSNGSFSQTKNLQSPTFSSFRPQDETPKQNYEGFTTRKKTSTNNDRTMTNETESETVTELTETTVTVKSLHLPEVRTAHLVTDDSQTIFYKKQKPPPPPRRVNLGTNYETRLYDTPRPSNDYIKTEEQKYESNQYQQYQQYQQKYGEDAPAPASPMSPKFNARHLKFDEKSEPIYSTLNKLPKSPLDGVGQSFSEHQKSTEAIPGGTKHTEYTVKSESYQSYPKTEYLKTETRQEVKSPFATSTPSKFDRSDLYSQQEFNQNLSTELVKVPTPDFERISSPYGRRDAPNFMEETTTEVKEIPNGTQKITTTKIYSSSPVNITSTNTKYEPIKLDGIDELSKSFDNESRYSTLDSKLSSDTSRSFMRPSQFQSSDFQSSSSVTKVKKPAEIVNELEGLNKKFSKQTITSETIEKKSVMTSSHKSESSSTVTKKFGNV